MNIFTLIDAVCEVYDKGCSPGRPYWPHDITGDGVNETFCNRAVREVCELVGYKGFLVPMSANEMVDFLGQSADWMKVDIKESQDLANAGKLVILGMKLPNHGHVTIVRPGMSEWSTKWNCPSPRILNIGAENSIAKACNWIFPGDEPPLAFMWRP